MKKRKLINSIRNEFLSLYFLNNQFKKHMISFFQQLFQQAKFNLILKKSYLGLKKIISTYVGINISIQF